MNIQTFLAKANALPYFDLPMALHWTGLTRQSLLIQLARWTKAGYLISLRRGLHTVAEPYRKLALSATGLANEIYAPSYLSLEWALSRHGIIPEAVPVLTSITTRGTKIFKNECGRFEYRQVKQILFFGYHRVKIMNENVFMAKPEKALLDFFYFSKGEWTDSRHEEMRWQNLNVIHINDLHKMSTYFPERVLNALDGIKNRKTQSKEKKI